MSTPTQPMQPVQPVRSMQSRVEGPAAHVEIRRFVVAVERQLDDLPADDVAELVGGLEADLTEAWVAEGTTPAQRFGSPEAYAGELRAAAGLPARVAGTVAQQGFLAAVRSIVRNAQVSVRAMPGWPAFRDLAITLRPVWWALRGYAVYLIAVNVFTRGGVREHLVPDSWPFWVALLMLVLAGVEVGRRSATVDNIAWRGMLLTMNVVAVGALLILGTASGGGVKYVYVDGAGTSPIGLQNGDYKVVNVFPYDRDGKPLTGVQLFDDRGRPLDIGDDGRGYLSGDGATYVDLLPGVDKQGLQHWNVFPLREKDTVDSTGTPVQNGPVHDAARPDATQGPLLVADASDTVTSPKSTGEKK